MKQTISKLSITTAILLTLGGCGSSSNTNNTPMVCSDIQDSATGLYIWDNGSPNVNN